MERIYNENNLTENDIDETITRTKAIIMNSKAEILLAYSYKTYQFPGGHAIKDEPLWQCLTREVEEETGLRITSDPITPFFCIKRYDKNYQGTNKNYLFEVYYYIILTDIKYDIKNIHLDMEEQMGNFELKYIPLKEIENVLIASIEDNPVNKIIVKEMLEAIKEYKKYISIEI